MGEDSVDTAFPITLGRPTASATIIISFMTVSFATIGGFLWVLILLVSDSPTGGIRTTTTMDTTIIRTANPTIHRFTITDIGTV